MNVHSVRGALSTWYSRAMSRTGALVSSLVLATLIGCGGGGGGGGTGGGTGGTGGGTGGGTTPVNPCSTALLDDATANAVTGTPAATIADKKVLIDGNPRGRSACHGVGRGVIE